MTESEFGTLACLEDTHHLACLFARHLEPGQFLALCGDLGAGKTTLTRFLTQQLGCRTLATSPTFSLFQHYEGGRLPVLHADLYRLGSGAEVFELGWEEMLGDYEGGVVVVEWADKFEETWPPDFLRIDAAYSDDQESRVLEFSAQGVRSRRLLEDLKTSWGSK
jgi:tRNA threonylcarbamoyladenosine biosynthesis protein TsaE